MEDSMLILSRKKGEQIHLGKDIVLTVSNIGNSRVFIGVQAPKDLPILRSELLTRKEQDGS